jgi:hypothetical protein
VLVSTRYKTTRQEIESWWSFEDLMIAHDTLDALEEGESRAAERARAKAEADRRNAPGR